MSMSKDELISCGKYHASKLVNDPLRIENNGNTPPFMLALLYGSWNVKLSNTLKDEKDSLPWSKVYDAIKTCNVDSSATDIRNIPCVYTKVDEDDESVDICVNILECPSELPALVFLCNTTPLSTTTSEVKNQGLRVEHVEFNSSALEALLTKSTTTVAKEEEYDKFGQSIRDAWLRLFDSEKIQHPTQKVSRHILSNISNRNNNETATRLFIAGDRSQVGKSSICLGLLGALLSSGKYKPTDLAYIKPATQCEQTQLVEEYCKHKGITDCVAVGPIVYYKGFTRAFLKRETGETSEQLLQKASDAIDKLALNKKVVIIDGVGYPAVGSITGTDNASVAKVCGQSFSLPNTTTATANEEERSPVPVLLVGKSGVGDAVDSFNINATYFIHRNVPVIGAVFNKLSLDGFYSLSNCKEAIDMYFNQSQPERQAFGYIPEISSLKNAREHVANNSSKEDQLKEALDVAHTFVAEFSKHVNVDSIIIAAKKATAKYIEEKTTTTKSTSQTTTLKRSVEDMESSSSVPAKHLRTTASGYKSNNSMNNSSSNGFSLTREQIEALASSAGAAGG